MSAVQPLTARPRRRALVALVPLLFGLVVVWSMLGRASAPPPRAPAGTAPAAAVLIAFLLTFGVLALNWLDRLTAIAAGTAVVLALGTLLRFYTPLDAAQYLWLRRDPVLLVTGIGLVTELLRHGGVFARLARWALRTAGTSPWALYGWLCLLTFGLSLGLNNLATIVVIVPLTLRAAPALRLDPVPLVIAEVIASNLGGAATMIGDLPNMIIADQAHLGFGSFLIYLAPVCLVQLVLLLVVLRPADPPPAAVTPLFAGPRSGPSRATARRLDEVLRELDAVPVDRAARVRGPLLFAAMLACFFAASLVGLRLGLVALLFGHVALFAGGVPWRTLVRGVSFEEPLFFACLFVMAGSVHASGILDGFGGTLAALWQQRPLLAALALGWSAAGLTLFVSAGPATALIAHLLPASLMSGAQPQALWWALSLGVCAGSSGTITGATAGPVAAGLLERHGLRLSFNRFARTGLPVTLLFLAVSSAYLALLLW